jgi:hypothetical protein
MARGSLLRPPVSPDLFEGDLYETPALAREAIDSYDFGINALPFMSFVSRNRYRSAAKAALATVPRRFEDFKTDKLTGKTGKATVYISRKIANETQPIAADLRAILTPATLEGTYRALGLGGWHVTIAKTQIDMGGMAPEEFAEDISGHLERRASGLLMPIGNVAVVGAKVCGNKKGGRGSSRFIGLTPHHSKGLLEEMRTVRQLFDPMVDVSSRDWYNTPHISIAKASDALFELPEHDRQRLEGNIISAVEERALRLRPLTLTAGCVELCDF